MKEGGTHGDSLPPNLLFQTETHGPLVTKTHFNQSVCIIYLNLASVVLCRSSKKAEGRNFKQWKVTIVIIMTKT